MKHASIYLTEGAVANATNQARNIYIHYRQELDGETDIEKLKNEFLEFKDGIRGQVGYLRYKKEVNGQVINGLKYIEGCTRIYFENGRSLDVFKKLDPIVGILVKDQKLYNTYKSNFNGLSFLELINTFKEQLADISANERKDIEKMGYTNQSQDYDIIPINNFNESKKYYPYCIHKNFSNNDNQPEWCLTYGGEHFDVYNGNGTNQIYFCIKKGIKEDDEPIQGEGHPQDDYGNSMISVIVDEEGELVYSTSRWNHELEGSDKAYSVVDISRIVGVDFYKTFLPNQNFKNALENAIKIYNQTGELYGFDEYDDIPNFPSIKRVYVYNKQNFLDIKKKKIISDIWFDCVYDFERNENVSNVYLRKKGYNIINLDGEIISDIWFDSIGWFYEGYAGVNLKDKGYNYINLQGELISNNWFDEIETFNNGLAGVRLNDKGWNFINTRGELIGNNWFYDIKKFNRGFAQVRVEDKGWTFINNKDEIVDDTFFDELYEIRYDISVIIKNNKYNFLNPNKQLISNIWFDYFDLFNDFEKEKLKVILNGSKYLLALNGDLYDSDNNFIKNVSPNGNSEEIANESLIRNDNLFINEVLDLNKRIKKLYE